MAGVDPDARDPKTYITVLSGDLKGDDAEISDPWGFVTDPKRDENSEHVVSARTGGETGVIDGFVITGGNTRDGSGAGVYCIVGAVVSNCVIGQNKVPCPYGFGGGIMMAGQSPEIRNCEVIWNWAVNGGGIGLIQTNGVVKGCTIAHNRAKDFGGGCYAYGETPRIENCEISDNSAEDSGGGIFYQQILAKLTRCVITRNSARAGGGCSCYSGINAQNSLTLEWCSLGENVASEDGGGIYCRGGQYSINPCLSLSNVVANGNVADSGGAIACYEAELNLVNSRFSGNKAKKGGALHGWSLYECNVINCVFAGNVGDYGGGIYFTAASSVMSNSILWGNVAKYGLLQAALFADTVLTIAYCDVQGGQGKVYVETGTTLTWGNGCMDADPCFVAPGYWGSRLDPNVRVEPNKPDAVWVDGDYHFRPDSPCIDKGDPKGDYSGQTDIDDRCRVVGNAINIGVDEEGCFPLTYSTYQDWIALGAPDCWCGPTCGYGYQCDGDADGVMSAFPFMFRVFTGDLAMIVGNWKKRLGDPTLDPCADIDHKDSGGITKYRVFTADLARLVTNWKKKDAQLAGNCPRPE